MQEALMLFESISNSHWFKKSSLILFLNKMDLFRNKLEISPISEYFPDYDGDNINLEHACKFFQNKFLNLSRDPKKVQCTQNRCDICTKLTFLSTGGLYPFHYCYKYKFAQEYHGVGSGYDHSE